MNNQQNLFKSFSNAFNGMKDFLLHDRNGKIHLAATITVIIISFVLNISLTEWLAVLLCIAIVMSLEMINAAIEKLCDVVHKDFHPTIKIVKDISAGAVLWASIISAIIACIIFIPKIIQLL